MACGAPVVASRIGAFEDTAAKAGLMFPPGDSAALAEHLIRLSNDGALVASLSDRGIAFSKSFSLPTEMEQYLRLYQELTGGWQADSSVN
jgi:glycosyltransferase involved in cell wall biosynthesis